MGPDGHARIFVAEHAGEPVSAALVVAFGDRVSLKRAAWSAADRSLRPNELLHWHVMRWARQAGYARYDLEGVDPRAASSGERTEARAADAVTAFKLGFGGEVALSPPARQWIANPVLRGAQRPLRHVLDSATGRRLVEKIRTR
jgi:lipid II:glycine glycyltransferase (peptidoglycan interpeptide bridge formation enzyme)